MIERKLAIVGGGQMGRALVGGMLQAGLLEEGRLVLVEPSEEGRRWWSENRPGIAVLELDKAVAACDTVVLAVKPKVVPKVASQGSKFWADTLVISIAAGVGLRSLCDWVSHQRIVRVMPNTPSLVRAGASAYCCGQEVDAADKRWVAQILDAVGTSVEVDEDQMDAVTGLSGSGPAYVCLAIEALADGGVLAGLPRPLAMRLACQTVLGTAKMIADTGRHPGELKDAVASPGGTTIAGLAVLEQNGVRGALIEAVAASANRSRQLGGKD